MRFFHKVIKTPDTQRTQQQSRYRKQDRFADWNVLRPAFYHQQIGWPRRDVYSEAGVRRGSISQNRPSPPCRWPVRLPALPFRIPNSRTTVLNLYPAKSWTRRQPPVHTPSVPTTPKCTPPPPSPAGRKRNKQTSSTRKASSASPPEKWKENHERCATLSYHYKMQNGPR